jgi:transcriptional regulator with XRE-family HTH domain
MHNTSKQATPGSPETDEEMREPTKLTIEMLGRTIRSVRGLKKLSALGVAETAGLTPAQYDAVEEGRGTIRVETLLAIAAALSVTLLELVRATASEESLRGERGLTPEDFEEHYAHPPRDS